MSDIADSIKAMLQDDEQAARAAGDEDHTHAFIGRLECHSYRCAHDIRHDPKRVLRQVDAHRKILDEHRRTSAGNCEVCREYDFAYDYNPVPWPCPTIRALADIYNPEESK